MSQGEYIAPEKIESIYSRSPLVGQVFVYGNSLKSSLVGIIVPDEMALSIWCKQNNVPFNMQVLCQSPQLKQMIMASILKLGKENNLNGFEQVKDIYLHHDPFTPQNGLLTASMKSIRHALQKKFQEQIDAMYKNLD